MWIKELIWIERFVTKIRQKHSISTEEVEEVLLSGAIIRRANRGRVDGEDVYVAYGQTHAGRYLFIVFIYKSHMKGLIISARDMTIKERKYYNDQKS